MSKSKEVEYNKVFSMLDIKYQEGKKLKVN